MDDGDGEGEWRPQRAQRVARWAMLLAVIALLAIAVWGTVSILFAR